MSIKIYRSFYQPELKISIYGVDFQELDLLKEILLRAQAYGKPTESCYFNEAYVAETIKDLLRDI